MKVKVSHMLCAVAAGALLFHGTPAMAAEDLTHAVRVQQQAETTASKDWKERRAWALEHWNAISPEERISVTNTAQLTDQIVLLTDHQLTLWNKDGKGNWTKAEEFYAGYGRKGLSDDRHEGDQTTPIGSFPLVTAFGTHENPGTAMDYRKITKNSYWADDTDRWVESRKKIAGEHLIDYYQYEYALGVGFNQETNYPGRGSAIFVHVKSTDTWGSAGCITLEKPDMLKLLKSVHNGARLLVVPTSQELKNF